MRTTARQWRRSRIVLLAGACALMFGTAISAVRQVAGTAQSEVANIVRQTSMGHAANISGRFRESARTTLLLARTPALRVLNPVRAELSSALNDAVSLSGGQIVSAALLDKDGRVYVQVVDGIPVDEGMRHRYFAPAEVVSTTLELATGVVHVSRPYLSKELHRWVIATSTRVDPDGNGRPRVLLTLSELGAMQAGLSVSDHRVLSRIVTDDGTVMANSRITAKDGVAPSLDADRDALRRVTSKPSTVVRDGQIFSFVPVATSTGNANAWWVVVSMQAAGNGSVLRAGGSATAMAIAALLLFLFGLLTLRRHRNTLALAEGTDPLTGLLNRSALAERGTEVLSGGRKDGNMTAVLCLSISNIRAVNDALGHAAGDRVVQTVSSRLRDVLRPGDLVVRLGGDEFAILLSNVTDRDGAVVAAEKVLATLFPVIDVHGHPVGIHATIGVAVAPLDGTVIEDLIEHAGQAMYAAQRDGAALRCFDRSLARTSTDHLGLVAELRAAIDTDQLVLHFQPKISLQNGRVEGVEAFIRWNHPRLGMLSPATFIPLAEETGLIGQVTRKAITLALAQSRRWMDEGLELTVAVNLSGRCAHEIATVDVVARGLTRWQIPPRLLELEITESEMITDPESARAVLSGLHELGVGLSMDDYGSGYSSLMSIHSLPVQEIKIDRLFLEQLDEGEHSDKIVRATIDLGHRMGLRVSAEGVETRETVRSLVALGCDTAQGNFFCEPMDANALHKWLRDRNSSAVTKRSAARHRGHAH